MAQPGKKDESDETSGIFDDLDPERLTVVRKNVRNTRIAIFCLSVLQAFNSASSYYKYTRVLGGKLISGYETNGWPSGPVIDLSLGLLIGALLIVVGIVSIKRPLACFSIALGLYVASQFIDGFYVGSSIFQAILMRAFVVFFLVRGIANARELNKMQAQAP